VSKLRGIPQPPTHLSDAERAEWRRVARLLKDAGLLEQLDKTLLAAYCTVYTRWVEAEAKVKEFGMVVKGPNGFPMQSPWLSVANRAMKEMLSILGELGMTPASRSRIPKAEKPETKARTVKYPRLDPRDILEHAN
jgi:P27 family predicted phage terminase small subunit